MAKTIGLSDLPVALFVEGEGYYIKKRGGTGGSFSMEPKNKAEVHLYYTLADAGNIKEFAIDGGFASEKVELIPLCKIKFKT